MIVASFHASYLYLFSVHLGISPPLVDGRVAVIRGWGNALVHDSIGEDAQLAVARRRNGGGDTAARPPALIRPQHHALDHQLPKLALVVARAVGTLRAQVRHRSLERRSAEELLADVEEALECHPGGTVSRVGLKEIKYEKANEYGSSSSAYGESHML